LQHQVSFAIYHWSFETCFSSRNLESYFLLGLTIFENSASRISLFLHNSTVFSEQMQRHEDLKQNVKDWSHLLFSVLTFYRMNNSNRDDFKIYLILVVMWNDSLAWGFLQIFAGTLIAIVTVALKMISMISAIGYSCNSCLLEGCNWTWFQYVLTYNIVEITGGLTTCNNL